MNISKDIKELIDANVISTEIASKIDSYYKSKKNASTNKLFIVFGILGALLVGLGILLILAHNWDNLPKAIKTTLAFIPLIIGQLLCGFTLLKKEKSTTWQESSSVFLFFSVGISISLISQIYNISGDIASFTITWMLLCLPLVYLLKSSATSLLYIVGITFYVGKVGYWSYPTIESYIYWFLFLLIIPHYYLLFKNKPKSNFFIAHNWFISLSILFALGTLTNNFKELMFVAYLCLLAVFYLIGNLNFFNDQKLRNNSYLILGSLGTMGILFYLSFTWYWDVLLKTQFSFKNITNSIELITSIILFLLALALLAKQYKKELLSKTTLIEFVFLIFTFLYFIRLQSTFPVILINLLIFFIGILTIKKGEQKNHLGILNYGLLIITVLIICRFFDTNLSFILRGLLFVLVGIGFFITNYWMLKKRKNNEK